MQYPDDSAVTLALGLLAFVACCVLLCALIFFGFGFVGA